MHYVTRNAERTMPATPAPQEEFRGMTFEQWVAVNADRIWTLMRATDRRDVSFNQLARELWNQL